MPSAAPCSTRRIRQTIPLRTSTSHLTTIIRALERREPRDKTRLYDVLARVAETYPRRGMMVLISDLFVDADDVQRGLRLLRQRGHDVLVLHVLDDDELDFPFARPARFEGLETADQLTCNPRACAKATWRRSNSSWPPCGTTAHETTWITP